MTNIPEGARKCALNIEIMANTLIHFKGLIKGVAKIMEVKPVEVIRGLVTYSDWNIKECLTPEDEIEVYEYVKKYKKDNK